MAEASIVVMNLDKKIYDQNTKSMQSHINLGYRSNVHISELAQTLSEVIGYQRRIIYEPSKTDGALRKWMDSKRINHLGWHVKTSHSAGPTVTNDDLFKIGF